MTTDYVPGDKLYVVVRNDLSPGKQLAQAIHAKDLFSIEHPEINKAWFYQSNHICVLQVENEKELENIIIDAKQKNIAFVCFEEPDYDNELTAAAFEPGVLTKQLLKKLQLAGI